MKNKAEYNIFMIGLHLGVLMGFLIGFFLAVFSYGTGWSVSW